MTDAPSASDIASTRVAGIDYLRIVAAIGIVWFHVMEAPARVVAYAGLPVFVILTLLLPLMRDDAAPLARTATRRARRLLLPWAVWYAVYAGFAVRMGRPIVSDQGLGSLLYGPALHLWFLPFAFVASLASDAAGRRLLRQPEVTAVLAPVVGSVWVWFTVQYLDGLDAPWVQFALAGSFAPFAIGLAAAQRLPVARLRHNALALTALLPAVVATGMWNAGLESSDALSAALGVAAVAAVLCVRLPSSRWVGRLATLTMGVYLIHPIALWGVYDLVSRPAWWELVLGGLGGAAVASALLGMHPVTRRIFFGEGGRPRVAVEDEEVPVGAVPLTR